MIEQYNPSESKYFTFKYRKSKTSLLEFYRIEVVKLCPDDPCTNFDIDLEKLGISEKDLIAQSERYAYFSSQKTLNYIMPESFVTKEVVLEGFTSIPTHFYKSGGGFSEYVCSISIADGLRDYLDDDKCIISEFKITKTGETSFKRAKSKEYLVTLSWKDFEKIFNLTVLGKHQGKRMSKNSVSEFFHNKFPKFSKYKADEASGIIKKMFLSSLNEDLIGKFTSSEIEEIQNFYEKLLGKNATKEHFVKRNWLVIKEINLETILKEFSHHLGKKTLEATWQKFFEKNIFIFDSRYLDFIPKFNLKAGRKAEPDFLVFDIYGFVDIYEIKTPETPMLKYDESHDNYYWSREMSEAISQLEKYIYWASENRTELQDVIKKEKKIDVTIIKPRGVLVIGTYKQLTDTKQRDDFKILRASLKNIDIILFDEIYDSLNNLKDGCKGVHNPV